MKDLKFLDEWKEGENINDLTPFVIAKGNTGFDRVLKHHQEKGESFLYRDGDVSVIINRYGQKFITSRNTDFKGMLHIFGVVAVQFRAYLNHHGPITIPKHIAEAHPTRWNLDHYDADSQTDYEELGALSIVDINHAFWQIAEKKGYISYKVYRKYIASKYKVVRLAALSSVGQERRYQRFVNGEPQETVIGKAAEPELQHLYHDVRKTCYYHMGVLTDLLMKLDPRCFCCYKTDGIYFRFNRQSLPLVMDYLDAAGLSYKYKITEAVVHWFRDFSGLSHADAADLLQYIEIANQPEPDDTDQ